MTTPDLEGLAREHDRLADVCDKDADHLHRIAKSSGSVDVVANVRAEAQAHRQAAALIRAKAPGRRDIARLIWPVAFGKRTDGLTLDQVSDMQIDALTKADAILALFHAPAAGRVEGVARITDTEIRAAYAVGMLAVPGSTGRPCDDRDMLFMRAFLAALFHAPAEKGEDQQPEGSQ